MSDPALEAQMNALTQVFDNARNAIIGASKLAGEVAALRNEVAEMRVTYEAQVARMTKDNEFLRERNAILDEHIVHARQQRDEAQRRSAELQCELDDVKHSLAQVTDQRNGLERNNAELGTSLFAVRKERDDAQMKGLELEEENKALRAQIEAIKSALGVVAPPQVAEPVRTETWQEPYPKAQDYGRPAYDSI
jgi:chromosome segregation ATPase